MDVVTFHYKDLKFLVVSKKTIVFFTDQTAVARIFLIK